MTTENEICKRCGKPKSEHIRSVLFEGTLYCPPLLQSPGPSTFQPQEPAQEPYDNWHMIPEEFQWQAMDEDGRWWAYSVQVELDSRNGCWHYPAAGCNARLISISGPTNCRVPWNESLQQRPKKQKDVTPVCGNCNMPVRMNVPRFGWKAGFVHSETGKMECTSKSEIINPFGEITKSDVDAVIQESNGLRAEVTRLTRELATLQAALVRHPASEPPSDNREVIFLTKSNCFIGYFDEASKDWGDTEMRVIRGVIEWMELPEVSLTSIGEKKQPTERK